MAQPLLNQAMKLREILPDPLFDRVRAACVRRTYRDGQFIHRRGDTTRGMLLIETGRVCGGNAGADGSFIISYMFEPGDTVGEFTVFAGLPRTHDLVAVGETVIGYIDKGRFDRLCRDAPELTTHFLQAVALRLHFAMEVLDDAMRLPVPVRAAKVLRHLSNRSNGSTVLTVRHIDIAEALGVTRVAIGNALKRLKQDQLIIQGHGRIEIRDLRRLDRWIDERSLVPRL